MKISFQSSGGFAGMHTSVALDTDSLSSGEAQQLNDLIKNSNFFELPPESPKPKRGSADYMGYSITVESEGRKRTVMTNDITMPSKLTPLIRFLQSKTKISRA